MFKLKRDDSLLAVIDMQEKLADIMNEDMLETVVANVGILAQGMDLMRIPVAESLQYPKGLGRRLTELDGLVKPSLTIEKTSFSLGENEKFMDFLKKKDIKYVILTGMEAHICILQTALDLLEAGYSVHIPADAVISADDFNWETALDMAQNAGAVITVTETVLYQLLGSSEAREFKSVQKLLKRQE